jgi:segregation and condensation protein B
VTPEGGERVVIPEAVAPELVGQLEAILFASDAPLPVERLAEVLEIDPAHARAVVDALRLACDEGTRGLAVVEVGGGVRLVTRPEHAQVLMSLQRLRLKSRLSRAAVETLTIVAYRQPISRPEIEQLRGVGTESVLTHLLERRLIRVVGRKPTPGRPVLYGTTREFLEHFGLRDLEDLPPFELPAGVPGAAPAGSEAAEPGDVPADPELADADLTPDAGPAGVGPAGVGPDGVGPDGVGEDRGLSSPA